MFYIYHYPDEEQSVSEPGELKMWLAVRTDLEMPPGKLAAQAGHGFTMALLKAMQSAPETAQAYLSAAHTKVVCRIGAEGGLRRIEQEATEAGIPCALITDAGRTVFGHPTATVCAFGPARREDLPKFLKDLQLL